MQGNSASCSSPKTFHIPSMSEKSTPFLHLLLKNTVNDLINALGVYLILGVQEGAFNRWESFKREWAFILVTYFNELNITVYSMLSAKNVFVLTESRLRA